MEVCCYLHPGWPSAGRVRSNLATACARPGDPHCYRCNQSLVSCLSAGVHSRCTPTKPFGFRHQSDEAGAKTRHVYRSARARSAFKQQPTKKGPARFPGRTQFAIFNLPNNSDRSDSSTSLVVPQFEFRAAKPPLSALFSGHSRMVAAPSTLC